MKVDQIETCVCIDHEPTEADSVYYGMPQFKVTRGQKWNIFCPNCGRGGGIEYKSQYLALKDWNEMQIGLKNMKIY